MNIYHKSLQTFCRKWVMTKARLHMTPLNRPGSIYSIHYVSKTDTWSRIKLLFLVHQLLSPSCLRFHSPAWTGGASCPEAHVAGESSPYGDPPPDAPAGHRRPSGTPSSHDRIPEKVRGQGSEFSSTTVTTSTGIKFKGVVCAQHSTVNRSQNITTPYKYPKDPCWKNMLG